MDYSYSKKVGARDVSRWFFPILTGITLFQRWQGGLSRWSNIMDTEIYVPVSLNIIHCLVTEIFFLHEFPGLKFSDVCPTSKNNIIWMTIHGKQWKKSSSKLCCSRCWGNIPLSIATDSQQIPHDLQFEEPDSLINRKKPTKSCVFVF